MYDQLHALNSWNYGTNMKSILLMILSSLVSTFANPEGMIFLSAGIKIRLKQSEVLIHVNLEKKI